MLRRCLLTTILAVILCAGCDKSPTPPEAPAKKPTATQPAVGIVPVVQDGLWGYIDADAKVVIPLQYQRAESFADGLAAVQSKGLWGFVNEAGDMVIPPQFDAVDQAGFSAGRISVMRNGRWNLIDATGQSVLKATFASPLRFRENLAVVREGNQFGYLDASGQAVIEPQYTFAGPFSEGLAAVMTQGQWIGRRVSGGVWGFISKTGQMKIPGPFAAAGAFSEGLAWVQFPHPSSRATTDGGYIDTQGQTLFRSKEFRAGREFHEGRAAVRLQHTGLWGFIDKTGQVVIGADYDHVNDFHEGLAAVLTFGPSGAGVKWGYINTDGEMVIPPRFDRAGDFRAGLAAVWIGEKLGYIGCDGRFAWPPTE